MSKALGLWVLAECMDKCSGLMVVTLCVACGHVVWVVLLMGEALSMGQAFQNCGRVCCVGCWRMGRGPWSIETWVGCACVVAFIKQFLAFLMIRPVV